MSSVTIIWSMVAAAWITLAAMHFLVWCRKRSTWSNLLLSQTTIRRILAAVSRKRCNTSGLRCPPKPWFSGFSG